MEQIVPLSFKMLPICCNVCVSSLFPLVKISLQFLKSQDLKLTNCLTIYRCHRKILHSMNENKFREVDFRKWDS